MKNLSPMVDFTGRRGIFLDIFYEFVNLVKGLGVMGVVGYGSHNLLHGVIMGWFLEG